MLHWFDTTRHYWALALLALTITSCLAVFPAFSNARRTVTRYAFIVMLLATLVAGRWPTFMIGQTLEYDESFNVATAITAAVHPIPWKSFDPATLGPLEIYVLDLPKLIGLGISYDSTHVMAVLVLWGMLVCLYLFLRRFIDEGIARIAVLPTLVFLAFTFNNEFEHYASELFALFLLSLALALAAIPWRNRRAAFVSAGLTGLVIGAMPFAKAQAIPLAAFVAAAFVIAALWRDRERSRRVLGIFALGLLTIPVLLLLIVAASGGFGDFLHVYFGMQTAYIAGASTPFAFIFGDPHFSEYALVSIATALTAVSIGAGIAKAEDPPPIVRLLPLGAIALLAVSLFVMFVPHKPWTHYVLFLMPPLTLLVGSALGLLSARLSSAGVRKLVAVGSLFVMLVPMLHESVGGTEPYVGHLAEIRNAPPRRVVEVLRQLIRPGDAMAMWGLDSDLYPATGALAGTRETNSYFEMAPNSQFAYYRKRFVGDIIARKPKVFVDAVAPGEVLFTDRATHGFETFPELAAVIHSQYELVCDVGGIRVYLSRAAAAARGNVAPAGCPRRAGGPRMSAAELAHLRPIAEPTAMGVIDGLGTSGVPGLSATRDFAAGTRIAAYGWALDPQFTRPGTGLILIVDGKLRVDVTAAYGGDRPDVAAFVKQPAAEFSGFGDAVLVTNGLSKGRHTVKIGVIAADKKSFYTTAGATEFTLH